MRDCPGGWIGFWMVILIIVAAVGIVEALGCGLP